MTMTVTEKQTLIKKFEKHTGDTGSPEIQVALISSRIEELNKHFAAHRKDHASRQGLLKMVGHRRRFLNYLKKADIERYKKIIEVLGLRK